MSPPQQLFSSFSSSSSSSQQQQNGTHLSKEQNDDEAHTEAHTTQQQPDRNLQLKKILSPHEYKLFQAITAKPNRVDMWVSRKDPMLKHEKLLSLYHRFFEIANQYNITYWLEYGSSLGYCRHGGIMPWEWDMDIGITSDNFAKLQNIADEVNEKDKVFMFRYYTDPDYEQAAYSFLMRDDEEVLCDICEYVEEGDRLVCAVKEWHYPDWNRDDVLPPRRVMMLGESALIMNKAEKVLGYRRQKVSLSAMKEDCNYIVFFEWQTSKGANYTHFSNVMEKMSNNQLEIFNVSTGNTEYISPEVIISIIEITLL
jgi:hypothetical protein